MRLRLRRWPGKAPFEEEDWLLELDERVEELEETMGQEFEPELYTSPDPALESYLEELEGLKEWKQNYPKFWKAFAKKNADIETLAFYLLPEDIQQRLMN